MATQTGWKPSTLLLILLFAIVSIIVLFPLYAITLASFKPSTEMMRQGLNVRFDSHLFSWNNFISVFEHRFYVRWYANSLFIAAIFTVCSIILSSVVGYALAIYEFKGRNLIFVLVLVTLMLPTEIIILPLFKLMISFKMINTYWAVILPFVVAPLPIFFFRQYVTGLPKDFIDAGRIDGCTELGIFARIFVPLMLPAFGAMAILQAIGSWNNFLWPLIVLRANEKFTIPIGISTLLTPYGNNFDVLVAGSLVAILPLLTLYIFFQRYFISGLTVGGVKG
ncbi:MAG: carbohydrate ABC transporter permease [Paenibacillaceae bacterium]